MKALQVLDILDYIDFEQQKGGLSIKADYLHH